MRIAVVGYEANIKNRVGSNQYAFELIRSFYDLDRKNQYTVYLPTPPLPDLPRPREGWSYKVVGPPKFWNIFGLPRALFQQKPAPDVVFSPGHYCPLFSPAPLVVSIMDLGYLHFPQHFTKPIYWKLKFWTAFSIKKAAHIFAISQTTKNDIIRYYKVDPGKITVTYPGYDRKKFKVQSSKFKVKEVKRKYKIEGDYILFLGTLKPSKNIEGLLEAFKLLITNYQLPITLVIAGKKGWMFEEIFKKVKKLGLEDKVIFTDFVNEEDVPALMAGAKVFVTPSFWEGFGIPVVEAMACGTPVVVSNSGSLPEIVDDAGVIVDPYDPNDIAKGIKETLESNGSNHRTSLIDKGLRQVKKFDWESCAKKTLSVLEKIGGAA
jgi:glycosyltransferase involved in cell wall biosynthesis